MEKEGSILYSGLRAPSLIKWGGTNCRVQLGQGITPLECGSHIVGPLPALLPSDQPQLHDKHSEYGCLVSALKRLCLIISELTQLLSVCECGLTYSYPPFSKGLILK